MKVREDTGEERETGDEENEVKEMRLKVERRRSRRRRK